MSEMTSGLVWKPGQAAEYTGAVRPIYVTILREVEGWWEVTCSDGSTAIVRPSRLRARAPLPAPPGKDTI